MIKNSAFFNKFQKNNFRWKFKSKLRSSPLKKLILKTKKKNKENNIPKDNKICEKSMALKQIVYSLLQNNLKCFKIMY